jgi:hypothetical protein
LKHGGYSNDSSIRLYRKNAAKYELRDGQVKVVLDHGNIGKLASRLQCELYLSFERTVDDAIAFAKRTADDARRRGLQPTRRRALGRASWHLLKAYLLRWGWLDSWAGLHASCLAAFTTYLREAMLWELNQPAMPQRVILRESWQGLKLFDPTTSDSVPAAHPQPLPSADADREVSGIEPLPLRHAA